MKQLYKNVCPRCRSKRKQKEHLDGSMTCPRCGQRISSDGRLIPSANKNGKVDLDDSQLTLI